MFLDAHEDKWTPVPETGCLLWTAAIGSHGRPMVGVAGNKVALVSRVVCTEAHGSPPTPKHQAAHAPQGCIGGLCVAPQHLRWATNRENQLDIAPEKRVERTRRGLLKVSPEARSERTRLGNWNKTPEARTRMRKARYEALVRGEKFYYSDKPCRKGHTGKFLVKGGCIECRDERNAKRYRK